MHFHQVGLENDHVSCHAGKIGEGFHCDGVPGEVLGRLVNEWGVVAAFLGQQQCEQAGNALLQLNMLCGFSCYEMRMSHVISRAGFVQPGEGLEGIEMMAIEKTVLHNGKERGQGHGLHQGRLDRR